MVGKTRLEPERSTTLLKVDTRTLGVALRMIGHVAFVLTLLVHPVVELEHPKEPMVEHHLQAGAVAVTQVTQDVGVEQS